MERVLGIGGFFFRARNPDALMHWYADHLGVPSASEIGFFALINSRTSRASKTINNAKAINIIDSIANTVLPDFTNPPS